MSYLKGPPVTMEYDTAMRDSEEEITVLKQPIKLYKTIDEELGSNDAETTKVEYRLLYDVIGDVWSSYGD